MSLAYGWQSAPGRAPHRVILYAAMVTKLVVRRIGAVSLAKIQGALYALLGLVFGAIFSLIALVGSALQTVSSGTGFPSQFGVLFGVGAIIIFPILYGAFGFIFGLILGGLYNLLAGVVGGVEIEGLQTQSQ